MINFVAFDMHHEVENTKFNGPWVTISDKSSFVSRFRNWEPEVQALLDVSVTNFLSHANHVLMH